LRYSQLIKFITPHQRTLALIVVVLLAGTAVSLANPLVAGLLTESLLADAADRKAGAGLILLAWLALMIVRAVLSFAGSYLVGNTGVRMSARLRSRVYEHLQILPLSFFQDRKQGETLSLFSSDAESISQFVTSVLVRLLPQFLTLLLAFIFIAWLDSVVAVLAAVMLPAYFIMLKLLGRQIRPLSAAWIRQRSNLIAFVNENLGLMPVLKAFTREEIEAERFSTQNRELLNISSRQVWLSSLLSPAAALFGGAGALLMLWVAIGHLENGSLQPPQLVMLLLYILLMTRPLSSLADAYGQAMRTRGAADRLLGLFAERPEPLDTGGDELDSVRGKVEFRNITFSYPGRPAVFTDFSLTIEAGETIALTGPNGAGKSTLVHLLMRFTEPSSGAILIDGTDVSGVALEGLRRQIGLVSQQTLLLNGTVAENIGYGEPSASQSDLEKAAHAALAHTFIERLPDGYQTVIGDHGIRLSGGQRQRLSLARTLLKNPGILVLDEATSMFDPAGEDDFLQASRGLLQQRTVILISHRATILELADRVIQLAPEA